MPKYAKYSFTAIMCISCCMWVASGRAKNSLSPVWLCVRVCVCVYSGFTRFSRCVYYLRAVRTCVFVYFSRVCLCACVRLCNVKTTQCAVTFCLSTAESLWVRRLQHQPALCGPNTTRGRTLIRTDSSTESGRERRWGRHEGKTKKKKKRHIQESDMMWSSSLRTKGRLELQTFTVPCIHSQNYKTTKWVIH